MANALLELGQEEKAMATSEVLLHTPAARHARQSKSSDEEPWPSRICGRAKERIAFTITPANPVFILIANKGIHIHKQGAEKAIELYKKPTAIRWLPIWNRDGC